LAGRLFSSKESLIAGRSKVVQKDHAITLVFIINGENFPLEVYVELLLIGAVEKALLLSGNTGRRDPREWEVRDARGVLLEVDRSILDLGLKDDDRLFLSLRVGAGGTSGRSCN
jgi:hypothetical protein